MISVEIKKQVEWYAQNAAQQMKFANLANCDEAMQEHSRNSFQYMEIASQINASLAEKIYKKEMNSKKTSQRSPTINKGTPNERIGTIDS